MTYAEFLARHASVNDAECAEIVMRWTRETQCQSVSRGIASISTATHWMLSDGSMLAMSNFSPTTDRNATAMLVEEVAHRGSLEVTRFIERLGEATGGLHVHPIENTVSVTWWPIDVLLAAPSLVAWACCESCRGGAS